MQGSHRHHLYLDEFRRGEVMTGRLDDPVAGF
jgi:hypothetical protein